MKPHFHLLRCFGGFHAAQGCGGAAQTGIAQGGIVIVQLAPGPAAGIFSRKPVVHVFLVSDLPNAELCQPGVVQSPADIVMAAQVILEQAVSGQPADQIQLAAQGIHDGETALKDINHAEKGESATDSVMRQIIQPVTAPVLEVLCSLALFFLLQFIISLLLKLLNILAKIPVLKQANKALGIVAGVVQGALWALLIATLLQAVAATGLVPLLSTEVVESTIVVKWLNQINPLQTYLLDLFTVTA